MNGPELKQLVLERIRERLEADRREWLATTPEWKRSGDHWRSARFELIDQGAIQWRAAELLPELTDWDHRKCKKLLFLMERAGEAELWVTDGGMITHVKLLEAVAAK